MIVKNFGSQNLKDYQNELERGGKFVVFEYCVSIVIYTYKVTSSIYLVKGGESPLMKGMGYTLLTFFSGWWGIPWGPIYTIQCLLINLRGGRDVTSDVMDEIKKQLDPRSQYF